MSIYLGKVLLIYLVAQMVKNLPAMQGTWVGLPGLQRSAEDPPHSSILDWRIPWAEKPERLQFMGSQRVCD